MSLDASEEILIDVNKLCKEYPYCQVSGLSVSPDNTKISYGMDTLSRRIYSIYIKDLKTGKNLKDKIEGVSPYATWSSDSMYIFYTSKDSQTLRNDKIFRHQVGKNQKNEEIEKKIDKEVKEIINTKSYVKENVADDVPF